MLIIAWNYQGMGRPLTIQNLRGLCITHRPNLVFLMETKNKSSKLERIKRCFNFAHSCYVEPVGNSGGLALWWDDNLQLDVRQKTKHHIRCVVTLSNRLIQWATSFIYAPSQRSVHKEFWESFRKIAEGNQYPWMCIGDINEIGSCSEKQGGVAVRMSQVQKFQELLSECKLMDLGFKGAAYTWSNNQMGEHNVRERLDRAVTSMEWRVLYSQAQVSNVPTCPKAQIL
ncbi:uncharacterized protein LOC114264768 [Camellia sinensis]|uniref:uncharacterized protein LOC114264768 n=1 Tax=Camellia sinensis TaxID=4442 RepID=UPI001036D76F|nr:uncharacterized protein LOC114264768 [Camellia sinensis]